MLRIKEGKGFSLTHNQAQKADRKIQSPKDTSSDPLKCEHWMSLQRNSALIIAITSVRSSSFSPSSVDRRVKVMEKGNSGKWQPPIHNTAFPDTTFFSRVITLKQKVPSTRMTLNLIKRAQHHNIFPSRFRPNTTLLTQRIAYCHNIYEPKRLSSPKNFDRSFKLNRSSNSH